jgi:hypothetical protein
MATMTGLFAGSLALAAGLGIAFAIHEFRVAAELAEAVQSANTQQSLAEKALNEARFQSRRASEALRDVQTERDRTASALRDSEYQRERAQQALADAEKQRTRAETALSELQASRIEAESGRAEVRRLQTETYLDRGLRQCAQGDAVQGMLWLAEALTLASESSDLAEQARVARQNLAAWKSAVPRAKKQRSGSVVLDVNLDGSRVERGPLRPADLRPESPHWQPLFRYEDPLAVVFSGDARTALVLERQAKTIQAYLLGGGLASSPPPFERGKVFRSLAHPVACLTGNGRRALVQEEAGVAVVWDVLGRKTTTERPLISLGSRRVLALAIGPTGKRAAVLTTRSATASASQTTVVMVYDVDSGELIGERELPSSVPALLAFSHHARWLLAGDVVLDSRTLKPLADPLPFSEPMLSAAFSPAGTLLATTSARSIWLWDTSGKLLREIPSTRPIDEVVFDDDGVRALTRDRGHVQIWDVRTGRPVGPAIEAASGMQPFLSAALTPDGESLLLAASREAYRLPLPENDLPGTAEQLRLWVQVYTEAELAKDGSVRLLDETAWKARLESLRKSQNTAGT